MLRASLREGCCDLGSPWLVVDRVARGVRSQHGIARRRKRIRRIRRLRALGVQLLARVRQLLLEIRVVGFEGDGGL